jgi:hypothetical protein
MILSPLSRALLRAGSCLAGVALASPLAAESGAAAQPQPEIAAQNDDEEPDSASDVTPSASEEIIVRSGRLRGQLFVDQPPLLTLDEESIAAEGVTSITDLIAQISARTGSARGRGGGDGRPVILVNGIRIGSFREFANYPPEALARVEVFPEEVAQRFGFPPDRRVINLILKDNYSNRQLDFEFEAPSRGGYSRNEQGIGILKIADGGRINASVQVEDATLLTEAARDIPQTDGSFSLVPGDPDPADFRSLLADTFNLEANVSWAKAIIASGTSLSANLNYERSESRSLDGLNTVTLISPTGTTALRTFGADTPLARRTASDTVSAAGSINQPINAFRLTTTFDGVFSESETRIDRRLRPDQLQVFRDAATAGTLAITGPLPTDTDNGFDTARSRIITTETQTTLEGPLGTLPAGEVLATFDLGFDWKRIESNDTRSATGAQLTRRRLSTGTNLVVPLTSTREEFLDALGDFTLNLQAGLENLSDFGTLGDWNAGITWQPVDGLDLSATYIWRESAPSISALGNPQVDNLNVPVFDFVRGETVLATVRTGGNPDLPAETQRDWKFAATWDLPFWDDTRLTVEYIRNRSDNVVSAFPQVTAEIEAAFPDRVTRDADGRLVALDRRSVSFAETRADRLQFTLSTSGSIGAPAEGEGGPFGGGRFGSGRNAPAPQPAPPTTGAAPVAGPQGGLPGSGFAPTAEQREQFMAFRTRLCAEDGLDFLSRLAAAIGSGADISAEFPGVDPARLAPMLARVRGADGTVDPARLAQVRTGICAIDPALIGGGPGSGGPAASGSAPAGAPAFNPLAARSFPGWRYFANLTHTIELDNQILIAPGLQPLDQLDGDATGAFGLPRHSSRLEAGLFGKGYGLRLSGIYTGETRLDGSGLAGSTDLLFDDIVTFNLRVFANMGEVTGKNEGLWKDFRISLVADNLFDAQRRVRDSNGDTPIAYEPFVIDPLGLYLGLDLRKLF